MAKIWTISTYFSIVYNEFHFPNKNIIFIISIKNLIGVSLCLTSLRQENGDLQNLTN